MKALNSLRTSLQVPEGRPEEFQLGGNAAVAGGPRGVSGAAEGRREEVDGGAQEHPGDVQDDAGQSNQRLCHQNKHKFVAFCQHDAVTA